MKTIYIASSWKHKDEVEKLTVDLRANGYGVLSFIESNRDLGHVAPADSYEFYNSDTASKIFSKDLKDITEADMVIYLSPSGVDAAAEVGFAYGQGCIVLGLAVAKDRDGVPQEITFGLMRLMIDEWYADTETMIADMEVMFDEMGR